MHRFHALLTALITLCGTGIAGAALAQSGPKVAPVRAVTDTYFGTTVTDPYRYLEDVKNPEVVAWMRGQADYARAALDRIPGRQALFERTMMYEDAVAARVNNVRRRPGDLYFYEKRGLRDNQFKLYVRRGLEGQERLLVDPEALGKQRGKPLAINYYEPSRNGRFVAYGLSEAGSEDADLYVVETFSGRRVLGPVSRAQYGGVNWLRDDRGLFFNRLQELKPGMPAIEKYQNSRAVLLRLGADAEKAQIVLGAGVDDMRLAAEDAPFVGVLPDGRTAVGVIYHGTDRELTVYAAPLSRVLAGTPRWRKIIDRSDDITAFEVVGDRLFGLTHRGATRFRILETSLLRPDWSRARELVPESQGVITTIAHAADGLYIVRRDGAVSKLLRHSLAAGKTAVPQPETVELPVDGSIELAGVDHRLRGVLVVAQSWTRGPQVFNAGPGYAANTQLQPLGRFDALPDYVSTEVLVPSHDGALVPLSIVHRKDVPLDGNNPTLLWGYASYGITEEPWFSSWRLAWLERGGVFAVANPRGSGAFGQDWYKAGFQALKPNSWKDFIATAEYLVQNRYTSPARLGIWGGSAGGILVGRAMTERPDLFAAVVASVGVFDAVRAELTPNGVPNIPEFGTHKTEAGFRALQAMSTYAHIRDGVKYPAVLLTHGVNDPRVDVWQSLKGAARLQAATASGKPILLSLDYDAGHGIGDTKAQRQRERADVMAFLLWQFGVPEFQPRQ